MRTPLSILSVVSGLVLSSVNLEAQVRIVYANNDQFTVNTVSAFSADANGVLTEISGSPFATGGGGTGGGAFAVNRITLAGGKFLYASDGGTNDIGAFSIDPSAGTLTPVPNAPFSAGAGGGFGDISLAASPDGHFLFAGLASNATIVTFAINADGSLSLVKGIPVSVAPFGMKVSPDGKFLAAALPALGGVGGVAMYSIAADGTLAMVTGSPYFDGGSGNLSGVDINCAGNTLFGAEMTQGTNIVDVFSIASGGGLSAIQGSPFSVGSGLNSNVGVLSPNDQLLFVSNQISNSITVLNVAAGGALSLAGASPVPLGGSGSNPAGMATDQSGTQLYVAANPNLIYVFNVATDGTLSAAVGSPFSTNQQAGLLSLAAFPAKTCAVGPPPPPPAPPVISGLPAAGSCTLWSPSGLLVQVATVAASSSASTLASFNVTGTSNEPPDPAVQDIVITGTGLAPRVVQLRANRLGSGTGRVYTLTATAIDVAGNTTTATSMCTVPHDQGN